MTNPIKRLEQPSINGRTGIFYIVGEAIAFFRDQLGKEGELSHLQFWPDVVKALFPLADEETRQELATDAIYGAERGRMVFQGKRAADGAFLEGKFTLYGTPGCWSFECELRNIFGMHYYPEPITFGVDFSSDPHYRVQPADKRLLDSALAVFPVKAGKYHWTPDGMTWEKR